MTFGEKLRHVRLLRELNQTELAAKTGLLPSAIGHFEKGRRKPSFENLRRLAKALNITSDYLLGLRGWPEPRQSYMLHLQRPRKLNERL